MKFYAEWLSDKISLKSVSSKIMLTEEGYNPYPRAPVVSEKRWS